VDVWSVTETEKQIMQKFAELRQRLGVDGMCSEKKSDYGGSVIWCGRMTTTGSNRVWILRLLEWEQGKTEQNMDGGVI